MVSICKDKKNIYFYDLMYRDSKAQKKKPQINTGKLTCIDILTSLSKFVNNQGGQNSVLTIEKCNFCGTSLLMSCFDLKFAISNRANLVKGRSILYD